MPVTARSRRRPAARRGPVALHVLLYPQSGRMLAHVLETDSVSDGRTPDAALQAVEAALRAEFEFDAREVRAVPAFDTPAPTAYWSALKSARLTATAKLSLAGLGDATLLAYRLEEAPAA